MLLAALHYNWCWGTGRCYVLSSFRFFPGGTLTFSKYILWYERWQWSLLPLNLFPWHQETDISVSIWFWLQASGCYSKKMRVLCLTPSTVRLQSFSSAQFFVFSTVPAEVLLVATVFISYFSIVPLFRWPVFVGGHGRRLFLMNSSAAKEKGRFCLLFHEGTHMKIHIQIIHIPFTLPCFLMSRCLWRCRCTQQQTLSKRY